MGGPLLAAALASLAVLIFFVALWRMTTRGDPVEDRLRQYGATDISVSADPDSADTLVRRRMPILTRMMSGFGLGPGLARQLSRASIPMTVPEYGLIVLGAAGFGFLLGAWRAGLLFGLGLGLLLGYIPIAYLRMAIGKRQRAFTEQLPDVLDLLVGSLRAGYGLAQALNTLVEQLPPPASEEFHRVQRAVELGVPIQRALNDMADRVDTQDVSLVVTAITVQFEMGGNLAETLDTIADTVRDRIRMKREIRSLTAQQRLTSYILVGTPIFLAIGLNLMNPGYMRPLFEPGWVRILPAVALVMQGIGFMVIRKIVDIEV